MKEQLKELYAQREQLLIKIQECEQSLINENHIELEDSLNSKPEPYGDVSIGDIKFNIPKYVSWNNDKLFDLAAEISEQGGDPLDWIDTKLSVSETKYKAMPDILKAKFEAARTVKAGKINIKFKE